MTRPAASPWRRFSATDAQRHFDLLTPFLVGDSYVYVRADEGLVAWVYRCHPTFAFAHGLPWVYWIRREADRVEWAGDGHRLLDAKAAAVERMERIRTTGRG